jgi:hypothetical protein
MGWLIRFVLFRVIGGRAALLLALLGFLRGRRRRSTGDGTLGSDPTRRA